MARDTSAAGELIEGGVDLLRAAYRTALAAELPEELLAPAFEDALSLALRGAAAPVRAVGAAAPTMTAPPADQAGGAARLAALAGKLDIALERVADVFYEEEDQLRLGVAASRFGSKKSEAARRISLLVVVARQFDGAEQWTPVSLLREACQEYNAFDVSNFAKHILSLDNVLQFQGSGASRKVRLTRPGLELAAQWITELTS